MLSPALWCVYLDDLIKKLRDLKLGVHVAGVWMGATGYADYLLLLAPVRSVLAEMVRVCEEYGKQHNMIFSTDPVPAKSKTNVCFSVVSPLELGILTPFILMGRSCHVWSLLSTWDILFTSQELWSKIARSKEHSLFRRQLKYGSSSALPGQMMFSVQLECTAVTAMALCFGHCAQSLQSLISNAGTHVLNL